MDRRTFLQAASGALLVAGPATAAAAAAEAPAPAPSPPPAGPAGASDEPPARLRGPRGPRAVVTPNGTSLPWRVRDGVHIGHLVASPLRHEIAPGLEIEAWGYNGRTPGPTIEAFEGDRVRLYVTNRLPEPTSVHWHAVVVPNGMDGVAGITQHPIPPGATFRYEFTLRHAGTFMYHPHYDEMTQIAVGMVGMIVVHPRAPRGPEVDRDFVLLSHEWKIPAGTRRPDPVAMNDFNVLTFNSKAWPATDPLLVRRGERVRIRLGNLGPMDHHSIHLHGPSFLVTATDGGDIPPSARWPETTVLVPVGSTRTVELVASEPGDWVLHCHMVHHMMTQMGHAGPPVLGADPSAYAARVRALVPGYMAMGERGMGGMGEMAMRAPRNSLPMRGGPGPFGYVEMGGMFTVLKVREQAGADPAGWYEHPPGTVATEASAAELAADGIDADA